MEVHENVRFWLKVMRFFFGVSYFGRMNARQLEMVGERQLDVFLMFLCVFLYWRYSTCERQDAKYDLNTQNKRYMEDITKTIMFTTNSLQGTPTIQTIQQPKIDGQKQDFPTFCYVNSNMIQKITPTSQVRPNFLFF